MSSPTLPPPLSPRQTCKNSFGLKDGDVFACVADAGWITGHSYIVYGPLLNGVTSFMFESTPMYPDEGRYWDCVERHKINVFYTAPTAIRSLMRFGDEAPNKYDLSSLRVLGTVGEPINPEAWRWYYEVVGREKVSWQFGEFICRFAFLTNPPPVLRCRHVLAD